MTVLRCSKNSAPIKLFTRAAVALVAVLSISCSGRNVHKNLTEDVRVLVREWTLPTQNKLAISGDRGVEYSGIALFENTVIFGSRANGLTSMYPQLQRVRWELPIQGGVYSELTVEKSKLYFGGGDGFFYCVNPENGKVVWKYELRDIHVSKPTVVGGRVFVTTSADTVYAFDAGTGKWLWHYKRRTQSNSTIRGASSPWADNQEVLVGMSDGFLINLSVADGQLKWERKLHWGNKFTDVDAHPMVENQIIYVASYDGAFYALKRQSGDVIWKQDLGGVKRPIVEETRILFSSSDGTVYALQKTNGKILWQFEVDSGVPTELAVSDNQIFVGSSFQYFYVLDRGTGKALYRMNIGYGSGFATAPVWDSARSRVYALSHGGNLMSFMPRSKSSLPTGIRGATDPYL